MQFLMQSVKQKAWMLFKVTYAIIYLESTHFE